MRSRYLSSITLTLAIIFSGAAAATGQSPELPEENFIHRYADPGQPTITVHIWGSVGSSGIWKVERQTDLVELLSAARLTTLGQDNPDVRREVILKIHRGQGGDRQTVYSAELTNLLGNGATYPELQDGDILEVEVNNRRRKFQWLTQIVGTASSVALLILRITRGR